MKSYHTFSLHPQSIPKQIFQRNLKTLSFDFRGLQICLPPGKVPLLPNVCFTWLQTTEQRAIMSSAGLQIHLQPHGSQSNASKHDQLTNKIARFSHHAVLYIYLVLQNDERNLRVVKSQLCSCFWWAVVIRSFQDKFNFRNEFQHGNF